MKVSLGIALILFSTCLAFPQGWGRLELPENSVYFEALGNGITWSVNYDRIFFSKPAIKISSRTGYTLTSSSYVDGTIHSFHQEINLLVGRKMLFFETGPGISYWLPGESKNSVVISYRVGSRIYVLNNYGSGMIFRIGFVPLYQISGSLNFEFLPFGGAAIGAVF